MQMSCKHALIKALEIIELSENTVEKQLIIDALKQQIKELSKTKWTKELIFEAIDNWKERTGYNPIYKDFLKKELPSPITVESYFNMKMGDFLNQYYPKDLDKRNTNICNRFSQEEWIDNFKEQYNKIKPSSGKEFNALRDFETPTWLTISRNCSDGTWSGLLKKSNVDTKHLKRKIVYKNELLSVSHSDFNSHKKYKDIAKNSSLKIIDK